MTREELNKLTDKIIGLAIKIHRKLGPGFVEKIYEKALEYELKENKVPYISQKEIRVKYREVELGKQRVDFLIQDELIVEIKAVSELSTIHRAQLLSYLKTADKKVGIVLNFAMPVLEIKRVVNRF